MFFQAKIPCSSICKCVGCKNVECLPIPERKSLMQLAECAEARVDRQSSVKSRPFCLSSYDSPSKVGLPTTK